MDFLPLPPDPGLVPVAENDVFRTETDPRVFLVENGTKRWFPDEPTFFAAYGTYDTRPGNS